MYLPIGPSRIWPCSCSCFCSSMLVLALMAIGFLLLITSTVGNDRRRRAKIMSKSLGFGSPCEKKKKDDLFRLPLEMPLRRTRGVPIRGPTLVPMGRRMTSCSRDEFGRPP